MKFLIAFVILTIQCNRAVDSRYETDIEYRAKVDSLQNEFNKSRNSIDTLAAIEN